MNDTARGLLIGIFVGLFGGMLIGAAVVGLVSEYASATTFGRLVADYGQLASIILGVIVGAVASYRMLQNLEQEGEG